MSRLPVFRALLAPALLIAGAQPLLAQRTRAATPATAPAYDPLLYSDGTRTNPAFRALRWRLVGPFRGGRSVAVTGDPTRPLVFYFGAVNGGVWKTTNAGTSWRNITDGKTDISSVGAIEVAPSDPNVIYVGTGEAEPREDLTYGTGMYKSTDGGESWQHLGLTDTHQIGRVAVDPSNANRVFVAALGHAFGPNRERGVYRTLDGGATWKQVLSLNDSTGAIDVVINPSNPRIIFASMWKFQRTPWSMEAGGGRSGVWKSMDGGDTWSEITFNQGLPSGLLGKICLAMSAADPNRVYASIEATGDKGGIFRSDNLGERWTRVNGDQKFGVRAWYYSRITADQMNADVVYTMNLDTHKSIDGGSTWSSVDAVPHGDTHALWVDPRNGQRMISGNDGGAHVSLDGGETFSPSLNQPTAQFYHVTTDRQFPYRIYGAQQDNSTVSIASRSDYGRIRESDWWSVAGCENAHIAIDPRDPNITYGGCYMGSLSRHDRRTQQERDVSVVMRNYDGIEAGKVPERFQWTFPILFSPHDPTVLYTTSQHVWRTTTEGQRWERISPDLTRAEPRTLGPSGGPITKDMTGTEWYATIFAFAESPVQKGLLWAGSDDGLMHVSRDAGATWTKVTPPQLGPFTRISTIDPSPHAAGTAYVAANRYQQDDFRPYVLKTTDFGATWRVITSGMPLGAYTRAVREDPRKRGLLYAATEIGVWVSLNDGESWQPLQQNLPRVSVRDIHVHDDDVIVATHGRAFWALDNVSLLRTLDDSVTAKRAHLFPVTPALRFAGGGGGGGRTAGENPPAGAIIDYWLKDAPTDSIRVQFVDAKGTVLRTFTSEPGDKADSTGVAARDSAARAARTRRDRPELAERFADETPSARAGANRFVWDLRMERAKTIKGAIVDDGTTIGPFVVPGAYSVRLIIGRDTLRREFTVVPDPRLTTTGPEYAQLYELASKTVARIGEVTETVKRIEDLQGQLDQRRSQAADQVYAERVRPAASALRTKLEAVRDAIYEVNTRADQATLNYPIRLYQMFITFNSQVQASEHAPTDQHAAIYADLAKQLEAQVTILRGLEAKELAEFNALLREVGVPGVFVPARKAVP
jgi:photosystem II stability/assembly factor-like uncharacterized protein